MRKSDEQELIGLRSYRQHQDLVIDEQNQKIVRLEQELKCAHAELAEAQRGQKQQSDIEQRIEKEKRAFMRHYKKEAATELEKWKLAVFKWKRNDEILQKLGRTILEGYLKKHPDADLSATKPYWKEIYGVIGNVLVEIRRLEKARKAMEEKAETEKL